jgi:hypothetical protein
VKLANQRLEGTRDERSRSSRQSLVRRPSAVSFGPSETAYLARNPLFQWSMKAPRVAFFVALVFVSMPWWKRRSC